MARTVTIPPIQTTGLSNMGASDLYAIQEDGAHDGDTYQQYPIYPGLQATGARVPGTPPPTALNSPRKLSGSSSPGSTMFSRESVRSELRRSSSWGSKTTFESFDSPTGQWRSVDYGYRTPESLKRQRSLPQAGDQFGELPGEVLELILATLKRIHLDRESDSCATCWMRDLCHVGLASRRWSKFARAALYEDIQLVGSDSAAHRKKFKLVYGARMLLLRRTLRLDPDTAALVKSLKVPRADPTAKGMTAKALEQYEDLTASLIMACPNLERLSGPMPGYDHSFRKIFHALSTRAQLKQMNWLVQPVTAPKQKGSQSSSSRQNGNGVSASGQLEPYREGAFLDLHRNWTQLSTLSVHCLPGAVLTPDSLLTRTLSMLPSLAHLHLCNLPPTAFNDTTLLELPRLHTLSLTHITGITSQGLSSFATRPGSQPLRRLHLRHTPLTSLAALARILSNLTSLTAFSLAQIFPPLMPEAGDTFTLWMMPYLASRSLRSLHWDITSHRDCANVADDILARSIAAGGFPDLRVLRAPNDPDALFQDLCRPRERIDLPTDRFCASDMPRQSTTSPTLLPPSPPPGSRLLSRTSTNTSLTGKTIPTAPADDATSAPLCTNLRIARLAAQTRLEKARANPRFSVTVTDADDAHATEHFRVGAYLGTVGSPINYHLLPDPGSSDDRGGAVDARDLVNDDGGEILNLPGGGLRQGCTGAWNDRRDGVVADKKEKERWWHTERGRWTGIELQ